MKELYDNSKKFNACHIIEDYAKELTNLFSENVFGWVWSFVKERIRTAHQAIVFSRGLPYIPRMQVLVYRAYEFGVMFRQCTINIVNM